MSKFSILRFFNFANFSRVNLIYDGSFFFPLIGSGDKNGLSVSISNFSIGNVDITILAQEPKLAEYIPAMKKNLADDLKTDKSLINIKATTTEGMGFIGRKEGISAHAVVLIISGVK